MLSVTGLITMAACVQSLDGPCWICDRWSGLGVGLSQPCQESFHLCFILIYSKVPVKLG